MEKHIGALLRDKQVIDALAAERSAQYESIDVRDQMSLQLTRLANEAIAIIDKYSEGGPDYAILLKIRTLRHEHLAHHQLEPTTEKGPDAPDAEIESFFQSNLKLIPILLHIVGVSYEPKESAEIHRRYAALFWASVRGERTQGHPNYRESPSAVSTGRMN
jgi:AbiU2